MKPSEYFGCMDGDCPHGTVQECFRAAMTLADELHAEVERLEAIVDNLCWLFTHEYKANNPGEEIPDWLTVAASTRVAAEAEEE